MPWPFISLLREVILRVLDLADVVAGDFVISTLGVRHPPTCCPHGDAGGSSRCALEVAWPPPVLQLTRHEVQGKPRQCPPSVAA
jgi:hypothetical protein